MIKDRVANLFRDSDEDVRKVITAVIVLEQERTAAWSALASKMQSKTS